MTRTFNIFKFEINQTKRRRVRYTMREVKNRDVSEMSVAHVLRDLIKSFHLLDEGRRYGGCVRRDFVLDLSQLL